MKLESEIQRSSTVEWGTERQAQVAEIVRQEGCAKVDDLAQRFGVSTQTIRKDINAMCADGLLRRVHGGVELSPVSVGHYDLRRVLNLGAKRSIGTAAAQIVPDEASVAVSIGTTPEMAVASMGQHRGLRLFTNNLHVAMTAQRFETASVTIPGGTLRAAEADIVGPTAVDFFDSYKFDVGLFGVAAVDESGALLDLSAEDVHSREAITRNSDMRILVLDASKFRRKAHARSGQITDVEHVICDTRPPAVICNMLTQAQVTLTICDEGAA